MLCARTTFVKKNSSLVARIVSFGTVKSWNSIFLNFDFFFNSYVYSLTRDFIASTRAFNLLTCAFNLATRAFSLLTRRFELVIRGFELVTCGFEPVTCTLELVPRNSCFAFRCFTRVLRVLSQSIEILKIPGLIRKRTGVPNEKIII